MTGESAPLEGEPAVADPICPYLGMVGDRNGHHSFPSRLHLCNAGEPAHIGLGFQADYCLGGGYPACARYQRAEEAAASERAALGPVALPAAGGAVATSALGPVSPTSAKLGEVRSREERRASPLVSILLGLALLSTLAAFAIAAGLIKLPAGGPIAVVPTPTPTITAVGSASVEPTVTPSPSPTATPAPTPTPTPGASSGEVTHVVQPGETLTAISELYDVPIEAIVARNGLANPDAIQAGQTLIIPLGATAPPPTTAPPTGPPTTTPKPTKSPEATSFIYVVKAGDTLSKIADMFHVLQQAILDANPEITDPNQIFIGQEIVIPAPAP